MNSRPAAHPHKRRNYSKHTKYSANRTRIAFKRGTYWKGPQHGTVSRELRENGQWRGRLARDLFRTSTELT